MAEKETQREGKTINKRNQRLGRGGEKRNYSTLNDSEGGQTAERLHVCAKGKGGRREEA